MGRGDELSLPAEEHGNRADQPAVAAGEVGGGAVRSAVQDQRARPRALVYDPTLLLAAVAQAVRRRTGPQVALCDRDPFGGSSRGDGSALSELGMAPIRIPLLERLRDSALRAARDWSSADAVPLRRCCGVERRVEPLRRRDLRQGCVRSILFSKWLADDRAPARLTRC